MLLEKSKTGTLLKDWMRKIVQSEIDYMEYASDGTAQAAYVSNNSSVLQSYSESSIKTQGSYALKGIGSADVLVGDLLNENWNYADQAALDAAWNDDDSVNGVSTLSSSNPSGAINAKNLKCDSGTAAASSDAERGFNSEPSMPDDFTAEIRTYLSNLGTAVGDDFQMVIRNGTINFDCSFRSNGLFISNSVSYDEVGTDLVVQNTWQKWRFVVTGGNATTATCDVYLNDILVGSNIDCNVASGTDTFYCRTKGFTVSNVTAYIDYWIIGSGLIPPGSLNKTLTKTLSPTLNLTGIKLLKFDIRASRTGSNIKLGLHDSGGTTTEITPNILSADTYQTVLFDLSAVSDANKDVIDSIIITITNADASNTFYIDNWYSLKFL